VDDNATVPLYYDARGDKLGVTIGDLNERIAAKLEELENQGVDVEQRLEQELKRDYHVITAEKRLAQVARDFVRHYTTAWFKQAENPFRIAIVCAMWLTGFDVKCLATLYLDKPMQGHTLMQAIARVNRVGGGKKHGLIIDYNGMLKSLRKALAVADYNNEKDALTIEKNLRRIACAGGGIGQRTTPGGA
jgi:type I site-specific restriction-modification system R (restriction) subunit